MVSMEHPWARTDNPQCSPLSRTRNSLIAAHWPRIIELLRSVDDLGRCIDHGVGDTTCRPKAYNFSMFTCDHCGHMFDLTGPDHLRPMPELKRMPKDAVPLAIVCPACDRVHRITYPNRTGSTRTGYRRTGNRPTEH